MRPIDADAFREHILGGKPIGLTICQYSESDILAMIREQPTIDPPPNGPLTLEELREMDGEPVYSPRLQEWGLVAAGGFTVTNMVYICDKAGNLRPATVWLACGPVYRCKPEEESV